MSYLDKVIERTSNFTAACSKDSRKKYGQFFTSESSAIFMASLFNVDPSKPSLRILDAGAGTGILSVALVSRLLDSYPGEIHLVCYETDENVLGLLRQNLAAIAEPRFSFEIRSENYLLSQEFCGDDLFGPEPAEQYDLIIGNPPYKKVPKELDEAKHMAAVCHGAPNLYFMFWAMGIQNLKDGCEMVYIVPRSWTSGAYFKAFRQYLLSRCSIISIHLFNSRDKVFDGEDVLQETMIIKIRKNQSHPQFLRMSCTENSDFSDLRIFDVPYSVVVPDNDYVFLVTNEKEADVLSKLNKFDSTLKSNGTPMKTGLIVDFRARDAIRSKAGENTYPLLYSHNIRDGRVTWPRDTESEYLCTEKKSFLQDNVDYLLCKRFTAKEEKRRLQCGIYLSEEHPEYRMISTQNKVNFIKAGCTEEAFGLYVLLNSSWYDTYYRVLNGSTQVNSTEVNTMPVPSANVIRQMGAELMGRQLSVENCDAILEERING